MLRKAIAAGFGTAVAKSTLEGARHLYTNWDNLTPAQRAEIGTQTGLSALMTLGAAHGVMEREPVHPAEAESLKGNPTEEVHRADRPPEEPITGNSEAVQPNNEDRFAMILAISSRIFLTDATNCCVRKSIHALIRRRPGSEREVYLRAAHKGSLVRGIFNRINPEFESLESEFAV